MTSVLSGDLERASLIALCVGADQRAAKPCQIFELSVEDDSGRSGSAFDVQGPGVRVEFRSCDRNSSWSWIDGTNDGPAVPVQLDQQPVLRARIWAPFTEKDPFRW